MKPPPQLKTVMTPFPYSVDLNSPLADAKELMEEHRVRHLPVTDGQALVGVVTERDMNIRLAQNPARTGPEGLSVKDMYVSDAYVVDLNEPLDNVLLTMASRHIGSVVVTRKNRLAGVFTCTDACRCFGQYLRQMSPRGGGDAVA